MNASPPESDPPGSSGGPVQVVRAEGGFAYGVIGADVHVFGDGVPLYLLQNWRPVPAPDPAFLRELPSRLLNARYAVVDFTGREAELADLRRWRDEGPRLTVRWLHAPGGQGKTRLADRIAAESAAEGWKVVTAVHGPGTVLPPPGSEDLRLDGAAGLLLLVDYADQWAVTHLSWLFSNSLLHRPGTRTRVLLIARSSDNWPAVRAALARLEAGTSAQRLPELPSGTSHRAQMFTAARNAFAVRYALGEPGLVAPPASLDHPDFGLTLALHIAALVAVDAYAHGTRPPEDLTSLTVYLLDREQGHWARLYGDGGATHDLDGARRAYRTPPAVMNRTVFGAALSGPLPRPHGSAVVAGLCPLMDPEQILADHAACYPPAAPTRDTVLEPLYPDRLSEDFLALTLPGHQADYPTQSWAAPTVTQMLVHGDNAAVPAWIRRGLTVLAAAAARWAHVGQQHLYPLLRDRPDLAVAAGSPVLTVIADLPDVSSDVLLALTRSLPEDVPAELAEGDAALAVRLTPYRLSVNDDPAERAKIHVDLGGHLATLGRTDEALRAVRRGVDLWQQLIDSSEGPARTSHEMYLAQALNNLSHFLAGAGRQAECIGAGMTAVAINRRLAQEDPGGGHDFHLALSLSNLGSHLAHVRRLEDARSVHLEAVDLYRRLAKADPERCEPGLAVALVNLGFVLSDFVGGSKVAFECLQFAVDIFRRHARAHPRRYEPDLATALINTSSYAVSAAEEETDPVRAEAMRVIAMLCAEEAESILRPLAEADPRAYDSHHALSLDLLRNAWKLSDSVPLALGAAQRAVVVHRRLVSSSASLGRIGGLVRALRELAALLRADGREQEAAAACAEADEREAEASTWIPDLPLTHPLTPVEILRERMGQAKLAAPSGAQTELTHLAQLFRQPEPPDDSPFPDFDPAGQTYARDPGRRSSRSARDWGSAGEIDTAADRFVRTGEWAGVWTLLFSVPLPDAIRVAGTAPRGFWAAFGIPDGLASQLAGANRRHAALLARPRGRAVVHRIPAVAVTDVSFAHGRSAVLSQTFTADHSTSVMVHDLRRPNAVQLYRGDTDHDGLSCLGPGEAVGIRGRTPGRRSDAELVRYADGTTTVLDPGPGLSGASTAPTAYGFVAGLDQAPVAHVGETGAPLRFVPLLDTGLWRSSLLAVDSTGTRLAVSDGNRIAVADARLESVECTYQVPAYVGGVQDLAFLSPTELLLSGAGGGLAVFETHDGELLPRAVVRSLRLRRLFVIPAWHVVGGWAGGLGRPLFYDATTLEPTTMPSAALAAGADPLTLFESSANGRYVLYDGYGDGGDRIRHDGHDGYEGPHHLAVQDLNPPAAWLERPLAAITASDLTALDELLADPDEPGDLRPLLELLRSTAAYRIGSGR